MWTAAVAIACVALAIGSLRVVYRLRRDRPDRAWAPTRVQQRYTGYDYDKAREGLQRARDRERVKRSIEAGARGAALYVVTRRKDANAR